MGFSEQRVRRDIRGRFAEQAAVVTRERDGRVRHEAPTPAAGGVAGGALRVAASAPRPTPGRDLRDWANRNVEQLTHGPFSDPRDQVLGKLIDQQGWGPPHVGSRADVDAAVAAGAVEVHRGVVAHAGTDSMAPRDAGEIIDQLRSDPNAGPGRGNFGNGFYFSTERHVAEVFAGGDDRGVVRAAIHPEARIVDADDLAEQYRAWRDRVRPQVMDIGQLYANGFVLTPGKLHPELVDAMAADPGRFAALLGYDAVRVTGKPDGGRKAPGRRLNTSRAPQYVVLNRTALLIEDQP